MLGSTPSPVPFKPRFGGVSFLNYTGISVEQTKVESFVESWVNILIGFPINYVANIAVLPFMYNPDKILSSAFWIGVVFTVISVVRSYVLRRCFNGKRFSHKVVEWWKNRHVPKEVPSA
jgi:hypothetical protein